MNAAMNVRQVMPVATDDERVRIFRCGRLVDSFAVVTQRYLVLVDTMDRPESADAIMGLLEGVAVGGRLALDRPLLVVNTHGDWDHVWGNGMFAGPKARSPAAIFGHRLVPGRMLSQNAEELLEAYRREQPGLYDNVELQAPTVLFEGELTIHSGDLTLRLIPTPGHTPDHVAVWIPELRTLLAGDAAEVPFPYVSPQSDLRLMRASLQRMAALAPETVLYSHGQGFTDPVFIRRNLHYLHQLEQRCADFARDQPVPGDLSSVHDPPAMLGWPLEEALPPEVILTDPEDVAFYRHAQAEAIRNTLSRMSRD